MGMLEVLEDVHTDHLKVQSGDALCMFTDGLVEQENAACQEFSEERLQQLVEKKRELTPEELYAAIV